MLPSHSFPPEILDHVVSSAFAILPHARRPSLSPLSGLSFASKQSRSIVLRKWFLVRSAVSIKDQRDWDMAMRLGTWIREISCTDSGVRILCKTHPSSLVHLRAVCLDFNNHTSFKFRGAYTQALDKLPCRLTSLTLNSLPIINRSLLKSIAAKFVQLVDLRLSTTGRLMGDEPCCCSCCPSDGERQRLLSVQHSPIPDAFADARRLGHTFGTHLASLTSLKRLHLGIYLSPEHALEEHDFHDSAQDFDSFGISNPLARLAECPDCCAKYAEPTRRSEKEASLALAAMVPTLESIEWASCFVLMRCQWDDEEVFESWGTTNIGVVRNAVNVRVQRIPEIIYGYEWNYSPD